ncbi:hypothetical protein KFE25_013213 [Diacronema lutheri]|uniref:Uncharacterized protein n=1 Tax=Diacronema lutheri TaxID=2081491 RepID=A0A8J5X6P1_DIALT|nr:hypothetical protein KFE25_013213 [Diacronema lutheri]
MRGALAVVLLGACCAVSFELDACPADRCGAASAGAAACPLGSDTGLVSEAGGAAEKLFVRNDSPLPARLLRVDEAGDEFEHALLPPAGRITVDTAQGIVWRARAPVPANADGGADGGRGRLLLEHKVQPVRIDACACPPRVAPACHRPPFRGYRTTWDPVVFENASPHALSLEWFDGACEEALRVGRSTELPPFASVRFIATYGHTFRARAASGVLLREHTIGDVVIRACGDERAAARAPAAAADARSAAEEEGEGEAHAARAAALVAGNNALRLELASALRQLSALRGLANATVATPPTATAAAGTMAALGARSVEAHSALTAQLLGALPTVGGSPA